MARQVRKKMGWGEVSDDRFGSRTGLLGFIHNNLGPDRRVHKSIPSMTYGCIENVRVGLDFASVKEAEVLLRRARMLQ
jgi:hypothetical protein